MDRSVHDDGLRSIYAGAAKVIEALGGKVKAPPNGGRFPWDAEQLIYAVREPWPSKTTGASLVYGIITPEQPLILSSAMADNGVIFSDGMEMDYLAFTPAQWSGSRWRRGGRGWWWGEGKRYFLACCSPTSTV